MLNDRLIAFTSQPTGNCTECKAVRIYSISYKSKGSRVKYRMTQYFSLWKPPIWSSCNTGIFGKTWYMFRFHITLFYKYKISPFSQVVMGFNEIGLRTSFMLQLKILGFQYASARNRDTNNNESKLNKDFCQFRMFCNFAAGKSSQITLIHLRSFRIIQILSTKFLECDISLFFWLPLKLPKALGDGFFS